MEERLASHHAACSLSGSSGIRYSFSSVSQAMSMSDSNRPAGAWQAVRSVNRRCRPPPFQPIRQGGRTGAGCRAALARQVSCSYRSWAFPMPCSIPSIQHTMLLCCCRLSHK